ncbi:MAG: PaaI family thioesterase [Pseudomonadota bacterium]
MTATPQRLDPTTRGADGIDGPLCNDIERELIEGGLARLEQEPPIPLGFCEALGMRLLALSDGATFLATPHRPELVGDPDTGVVHGGVVTTLLDTAAGLAAGFHEGRNLAGTVTLDLRIDYMRPAEPGRVILAKARVFRRARQITFVRGVAFDQSEQHPVAIATGAFMNGGKTAPDTKTTAGTQGAPKAGERA